MQGLNRYAYVNNNPIRYTDPTGHRIDDGCRTEGCNLTSLQKAIDAQKLAKLQKESDERKCAKGNKAYCSGDPVEIVAFTGTMLVGGAALEAFILGGGAAVTAAAALWKTAEVCSNISFGWVGIGAAGQFFDDVSVPKAKVDY